MVGRQGHYTNGQGKGGSPNVTDVHVSRRMFLGLGGDQAVSAERLSSRTKNGRGAGWEDRGGVGPLRDSWH